MCAPFAVSLAGIRFPGAFWVWIFFFLHIIGILGVTGGGEDLSVDGPVHGRTVRQSYIYFACTRGARSRGGEEAVGERERAMDEKFCCI